MSAGLEWITVHTLRYTITQPCMWKIFQPPTNDHVQLLPSVPAPADIDRIIGVSETVRNYDTLNPLKPHVPATEQIFAITPLSRLLILHHTFSLVDIDQSRRRRTHGDSR